MTERVQEDFLETLWQHYNANGRHELPWRLPESNGSFDPYKIMVSELMLQQTQVTRVIPKYYAFLQQFPTVESLATAELGAVLRAWQGLGYNRRAKFLWHAAQAVTERGVFPSTPEDLVALPGVGKNTAGAILAYAYNQPVPFIETNIRTVYLHHFFPDEDGVSDGAIAELLGETLDREHPREFYWALMDYGAWLKTQVRNNTQSKHYTKQSKFEGSRRQIRGVVIRQLSAKGQTLKELQTIVEDERLEAVIGELLVEGMISKTGARYQLS